MQIGWNARCSLVVWLCLVAAAPSIGHAQGPKPSAVPPPAAAAAAPIQRQDTNTTGVVAEVTECSRKDGVLTVRVRLRNTSAAKVSFRVVDAQNRNYQQTYVTAENKKYFILTDSEKEPLSPHPDGSGYLSADIAPGGMYQWWAKYPAPPAAVKTVSLYTTWTPPFDDLPITEK